MNEEQSRAESDAAFDAWYAMQSHQLTNEQVCRLIWSRGWQAAQQAQPVQQPAFFTRTIYMRTTVHGTTCLDSLDGIAEEQKHLWKEVFTTPLVDAQQAQPVDQQPCNWMYSPKGDRPQAQPVQPVIVNGLPLAAVIEMAAHYVERGEKSSILAGQLRRINRVDAQQERNK